MDGRGWGGGGGGSSAPGEGGAGCFSRALPACRSLGFAAQAQCQIGSGVWPPAWVLLCLSQI